MSRRVLTVDDDPRNLKLVRDLLGVIGYETLTAADGREGIAVAKAERPDLILMDMQMPVMDGFEASQCLKSDPETRDIPIIALTSLAMQGDRERIFAAGCDDCLTKPLDTREFLRVIAARLNEGAT